MSLNLEMSQFLQNFNHHQTTYLEVLHVLAKVSRKAVSIDCEGGTLGSILWPCP